MPFAALIMIIHSTLAGLCLFCANLLLLRRRDEGVYVPLALLFLFQGLSFLPDLIADAIYGPDAQTAWQIYLNVLISPLDLASPLLFWLYVRALTSEGPVMPVSCKFWHAGPIIAASLCITPVVAIPADILNGITPPPTELMPHIRLITQLLLVADMIFMAIVTVYITLTIRRLQRYRKRLRDIFASTENRELTWIWLITISTGIYLLVGFIDTLSDSLGWSAEVTQTPIFQVLAELIILVLMWTIGVWGLRQRPGLRSPSVEPVLEQISPELSKYKHSALDDERAKRIAAKIETAMQADLLYRDPNLSLWDLSKHISVTAHYVSQTLNTQLGRSFFDYVNYWRIKEAVKRLTTTKETTLVIALDVGFNSRSSFYKAFKRETGKTPRDIREK
ncbi:AraC family transcriptional regulator [Yoonia sp. I 8.24]|uniref:helix-turn-helix domain-containing protein n=1 Tax=Yoonia sp. I 8.24 TaxID=1537229 RepID=UPI001EDE56D8|nr:helix-turn-helix transcriptional regulator [Yoonia sp. I 8.24]MCG3267880.1 helix-turn-helix domain-containing protein [Yoonia sp. I 8.24]